MIGAVASAACGRDAIDREALLDPATCTGCHAAQVDEWASSMHAHASDDPVFVALEQLGQRETDGALGTFCVGCHAPLGQRGVTCVACHQIEAVTELHNGGLAWAEDGVMRGAIADPVETSAHGSTSSPLLASDACGACHDVVLANGVGVETTYAEWAESVFARPDTGVSCAACHMPGRDGPGRRQHDHRLAGVDTALIPWPGVDEQRAAIARDLDGVLAATLCVRPGAGGVDVDVTLDNVLAGHAFPSGVTHARRAWVELVAEEAGAVTFELGKFADDEIVTDAGGAWVLRSRFLDDTGAEVDRVWQASATVRTLLAPAVTTDPTDPAYYHAQTRTWHVPGAPDAITMIVRLEPVGLDVLDLLIGTGDLDPAIRDRMPRHELAGTARTWRRDVDGIGACLR